VSVQTLARREVPGWLPGDAEIIRQLAAHQPLYRFHKPRYQLQLLKDLALLLPAGPCRVLDVGAGSGLVAEMIAALFPGKTVVAVDVTRRILPTVGVPFRRFDGQVLPFDDHSFDCALLCNVLHHVRPGQRRGLLTQALRVTGGGPLVIKDHLAESRLDHLKLAWLDVVGNAPFGGMMRAQYLSGSAWNELIAGLACTGEVLPGSLYRSGLFGLTFANRLEVCLRVRSAGDDNRQPVADVSRAGRG
jgi:SAM-dependent methyltransferase